MGVLDHSANWLPNVVIVAKADATYGIMLASVAGLKEPVAAVSGCIDWAKALLLSNTSEANKVAAGNRAALMLSKNAAGSLSEELT